MVRTGDGRTDIPVTYISTSYHLYNRFLCLKHLYIVPPSQCLLYSCKTPECGCGRRADKSTRPIGPDAQALLESSGFDLIQNPEDAAPSREWVLENLRNPDVHGVCIMHPHKSDRVDQEFLDACNPNIKVVSTMSVGFGTSISPFVESLGGFGLIPRSHRRRRCKQERDQDRTYPRCTR